MWLQVATQPDLSYAVNVLSCFAHNPGKPHWNTIKHVLGYIKRMIDYEVTYKATGDLNPIGYVDSDFAGCKDTRCSTEGNIFLVAGGPISWESKKQETVALLIVEAEYAFSRATTQALWISKYLCAIGLLLSRPITIYADNKGLIAHCLNDKNHRRTKHIDIRLHFVKDQIKFGKVNFEYIVI